jgi:hypothetical protein
MTSHYKHGCVHPHSKVNMTLEHLPYVLRDITLIDVTFNTTDPVTRCNGCQDNPEL